MVSANYQLQTDSSIWDRIKHVAVAGYKSIDEQCERIVSKRNACTMTLLHRMSACFFCRSCKGRAIRYPQHDLHSPMFACLLEMPWGMFSFSCQPSIAGLCFFCFSGSKRPQYSWSRVTNDLLASILEQSCLVLWENIHATSLVLQLQERSELGSLFGCPGIPGSLMPRNGTSLCLENEKTYQKSKQIIGARSKEDKIYTVQYKKMLYVLRI